MAREAQGTRVAGKPLSRKNLPPTDRHLPRKSIESDPIELPLNYEVVGRIINLPEDHDIAYMIAIGKGIKDPWPRPGQLPLDEVLIENGF